APAARSESPAMALETAAAASDAVVEEPRPEVAAASPGDADGLPPAGVPEVTAPKLKKVNGAVVIRRGDTLWRISRRVYGHGIRYSTIYLANRNQIRDPDRIWPGQVFRVPEKSKQGEAADLSRMGNQVITLPAEKDSAARD